MGPDIFVILAAEHRTVDHLFDQIEALGDEGEVAQRTDLFHLLEATLRAHAEAEDAVVYDRLAELPAVASLIREAREEHDLVRLLLDEMNLLPADEPQWDAKLAVLRSLVRHHVGEEEGPIFEAAREALDAAEAAELAEAFLELSEQLTGARATVTPERDRSRATPA
jgi:hemerythrin superfamily protein